MPAVLIQLDTALELSLATDLFEAAQLGFYKAKLSPFELAVAKELQRHNSSEAKAYTSTRSVPRDTSRTAMIREAIELGLPEVLKRRAAERAAFKAARVAADALAEKAVKRSPELKAWVEAQKDAEDDKLRATAPRQTRRKF